MKDKQTAMTPIAQAGADLFDFAVDREDVKWLMDRLPPAAEVKRPTVEYELQLLKIVTVGWSIAYRLAGNPRKTPLSEAFWASVREFSRGLDQTTELMTGQDIDYFQTLHDRLDMYVAALGDNPDISDPAAVIGPTFAFACGNAADVFAAVAGAKMFATTAHRVQAYLDAAAL